ncbi:MAG TPA: hypothetical protein VN451_07805 [Chitinophagaceae bacterium]|nr:hypothetical protein [Chitinophagaceae bacterium]
MKKTILPLLIGSLCLTACSKADLLIPPVEVPCELQKANPAGESYTDDSVIDYNFTEKHCGIMPLSSKNFWVYEDSIFSDGIFIKVQYDTLRYTSNKKSMSDGIVWWEGNIFIGLPNLLYANDSSFFSLSDRLFTPGYKDAKKEFGLFPGDSVKYLTSFDDIAAQGRSLKIHSAYKSATGSFNECLYFEKNARNYRKDQLYFKEGIGVIKYIQEKAPMGQRVIKLQQVSTLIAYHIE